MSLLDIDNIILDKHLILEAIRLDYQHRVFNDKFELPIGKVKYNGKVIDEQSIDWKYMINNNDKFYYRGVVQLSIDKDIKRYELTILIRDIEYSKRSRLRYTHNLSSIIKL